MTGVANPWLPVTPEETQQPPAASMPIAATGPTGPQRGVSAPDQVDQLPVIRPRKSAALWVLGAHGGAGAWSLASLVDGWISAEHTWPVGTATQPTRVVVTARTNARGLGGAKHAARQWAAGLVPGTELLGLVLIADAPGRPPKALRDLMKIVGGGYPRTWHIPWIESWRLGKAPSVDTSPREVLRLIDNLSTLLRPDAPPTERN